MRYNLCLLTFKVLTYFVLRSRDGWYWVIRAQKLTFESLEKSIVYITTVLDFSVANQQMVAKGDDLIESSKHLRGSSAIIQI